MDFRNLFRDESAVSPVIGVILMVAITVILAAVIGTFVLGLGDQVQTTAPQASFTFEYDGAAELTITHDGGDQIDEALLSIKDSDGDASTVTDWPESDVSAGDSYVAGNIDSDETVRVVWSASSGDSTATLGKWTGPA